MYGQEELSVQDLLGKELKSEAGDLPSVPEWASVHMHCTAVTAAKGPGWGAAHLSQADGPRQSGASKGKDLLHAVSACLIGILVGK